MILCHSSKATLKKVPLPALLSVIWFPRARNLVAPPELVIEMTGFVWVQPESTSK